jgi:YbbR domain-containing protein
VRRLLLENLGWKLLSLAIAILLWIVVVGRPSRIVRAIPSNVRLLLERRQSREVPVHVLFSGSPPEGCRIKGQRVRPPTVTIAGPESRVSQVEYAETESIDLAGVVGDREFQVQAVIADPHVRVESSPDVAVQVVVEQIRPAEAR